MSGTSIPTPTETPTIWQELETWGQELQPWQRFILSNAINCSVLIEEHIEQAYRLFLENNGLIPVQTTPAIVIKSVTSRPSEPSESVVRLAGIRNLQGVNALPGTANLTFGTGLTVIYGPNGAGKSGFVRVFANACFSRYCPDIHPNIYSENALEELQAELVISNENGEETPLSFNRTTGHPLLKRFSVFDSDVAKIHLTERNVFSFKPAGFDVFNEMTRVYGVLSDRLSSGIDSKRRLNDFSKYFLDPQSPISQQVAAINYETDLTTLKTLAVYGETEQSRLAELTRQLEEIQRQGVAETLKQFAQIRVDLLNFSQRLTAINNNFRQSLKIGYLTQLQECQQKNAAAVQMGSDQFKQTFFQAVGSPEWEQFLISARDLAHAEHHDYPRTEDHCLLCHKPLDQASITLVQRFWTFLGSTARQEAEQARQRLQQTIFTLRQISFDILPLDSRVRSYLGQSNLQLLQWVETTLEALRQTRDSIVTVLETGNGTLDSSDIPDVSQVFNPIIEQIQLNETQLQQMNAQQAIQILEAERVSLRHREVLSRLIQEIETFVLDQKWVNAAEQAKRLLNTRSITDKQKQLFESVVGTQYRETLKQECERLKCYFPLELKTRGDSGQTLRDLTLQGGHQPHQILSEGEQRAVALADFLAEVNMNSASAGIILDDPVNSQDHERKALIARRLVTESLTRQVIVFTHDMVFLTTLCNIAKQLNQVPSTHWVQKDSLGKPGLVTLGDCPATTSQYLKTDLVKAALERARQSSGSSQVEIIRDGMAKLRTTLEEIVPRYIFQNVVQRWTDRVIVTALPKVNWQQDKVLEIVRLFEELSCFIEGHSHTEELAGAPPTVQDLESMINQVDTLIKQIKAERQATT
jgi:energy-coupling factor transporter ATP-binding protein EcfA2